MPTTIQEIYSQITHTLPPADRLRLVTLILNDLVQNNTNMVDDSDAWTKQDQLDLTVHSLQHTAAIFSDDEEMV
ncbi:hypothetical protein PN477_15205 [Spirulina subsalsa CS-330]|nr:hypothetical protein [Spirulina subsalsa CS-330]